MESSAPTWHTLALCTPESASRALFFASRATKHEGDAIETGRDLQRELSVAGFTGVVVRLARHANRNHPGAVIPSPLPPR